MFSHSKWDLLKCKVSKGLLPLLYIIFKCFVNHQQRPAILQDGDHFLESFNPGQGLLLAIRNPSVSHSVDFWDRRCWFLSSRSICPQAAGFLSQPNVLCQCPERGRCIVWDGEGEGGAEGRGEGLQLFLPLYVKLQGVGGLLLGETAVKIERAVSIVSCWLSKTLHWFLTTKSCSRDWWEKSRLVST